MLVTPGVDILVLIPAEGSFVTVKTAGPMRPPSALHSTGTLLSKISSTRLKVKDETLGKTHTNSARSTPQQPQVPTSLQTKCVKQMQRDNLILSFESDSLKCLLACPFRAHLCLSQRRGMPYYYLKPQQCSMLMKFLLCSTDQIIHCIAYK